MPITSEQLAQESTNAHPDTTMAPPKSEAQAYTTAAMISETIAEFERQHGETNDPGEEGKPPEPVEGTKEVQASPEPDSNSQESEPERTATPAAEEGSTFGRLAKRERELRERENTVRLKEMAAQEDQRKTPVKPKVEEKRQLIDREQLAGMNPLELLQEFGLTYDDVATQLTKETDPAKYRETKQATAGNPNDDRIASLEARISQQMREKDEQSYKTAMNSLLDEIGNFVENSGGKYELVQSSGNYPMVAEMMQRHYQTTSEALPYEEAAKRVEDYLENQLRQYAGSKKIATMFNLAETKPVQQEVEAQGQKQTLTRAQDVTPQKSSPEEAPQKMTRDQSLAWIASNMDMFS